jgi:hypothetical protein
VRQRGKETYKQEIQVHYKLLESGKQVVWGQYRRRRLWVGGSVSEAMSSLGCTLM